MAIKVIDQCHQGSFFFFIQKNKYHKNKVKINKTSRKIKTFIHFTPLEILLIYINLHFSLGIGGGT